MTVFDLEEAELAYAPQFGSAKDPINMVGFVAAAIVRGDYPQVHVEDLRPLWSRERPMLLLDVRTPDGIRRRSDPGRGEHPDRRAAQRMDELPRGRRRSSTARSASAATSPPECSASRGMMRPISGEATRSIGCSIRIGRAIHLDWIPRIGHPPLNPRRRAVLEGCAETNSAFSQAPGGICPFVSCRHIPGGPGESDEWKSFQEIEFRYARASIQ